MDEVLDHFYFEDCWFGRDFSVNARYRFTRDIFLGGLTLGRRCENWGKTLVRFCSWRLWGIDNHSGFSESREKAKCVTSVSADRFWEKSKGIGCFPQMSSKLSERSKKETQVTRREGASSARVPLKDVVADCERRWFAATLQAAKNGDVDMQFLAGQMFCSGYGIAVDLKKVKICMWLSEWLLPLFHLTSHVCAYWTFAFLFVFDCSGFSLGPKTGEVLVAKISLCKWRRPQALK